MKSFIPLQKHASINGEGIGHLARWNMLEPGQPSNSPCCFDAAHSGHLHVHQGPKGKLVAVFRRRHQCCRLKRHGTTSPASSRRPSDFLIVGSIRPAGRRPANLALIWFSASIVVFAAAESGVRHDWVQSRRCKSTPLPSFISDANLRCSSAEPGACKSSAPQVPPPCQRHRGIRLLEAKIFFWSSGAMPIPESLDRKRSSTLSSLSGKTTDANVMLPSEVNFSALPARLSWDSGPRRRGSPDTRWCSDLIG